MLLKIGLIAALLTTPTETPVADAAEHNNVQSVRYLLQHGEDVNAAQSDGLTALHWAALNNNLEVTEILLYAGGSVKSTTRVGGYTPLHLASQSGYFEIMGAILEAGADPNQFTSTGITSMHFAAVSNVPEAIHVLAGYGGNINVLDNFANRTPVMFASVKNANTSLGTLIDLGANLEMTTRIKNYVERANGDNEDRVQRNRVKDAENGEDAPDSGLGGSFRPPPDPDSIKAEAPPIPVVTVLSGNEQIGNQGGLTALHLAAREGHIESALRLVEGGADVNHVTEGDLSSPLLVAVINGNYDLAKMLLEHGADPNLLSDDNAGPLFATLNIEWSLRTWYPQPSMFRQQENTYLDLLKLLLDVGAEPNQRVSTHIWYAAYNAGRMGVDFTGATPFWRAAYAHDVNAMRILADYGADPNIWTTKLPSRRRGDQDSTSVDPSGLEPIPDGGPGVHPIHAASGVGFGTSRVAQQHRGVPDGWLPAVKYLVEEHGIDPNLRDMGGYSSMHHAAARGDNETILYLVRNGADVGLISRSGQTTADLANSPEQRAQPHPVTVALLEKLGSRNNHNCRSCGTGN
jgi:ankyrin repeat protein